MSRNPVLRKERNDQIRALYAKYQSEFVTGPKGQRVEKYRHQAILVMVAKRFFLEPGTIDNILSSNDEIDDSRQTSLFTED